MRNLIPTPGSLFDRVLTFVLANILWFVLAMLIIPLPAATAGLFASLAPLVRGRDTEIFATFFGTMRRQWLKSTVIFAADIVIGVLLVINFKALSMMELDNPILWLFRIIYIFFTVAVLLVNLYLWPLLVLFDLDLRRLFSVSLRLAFAHPLWSLFTLALALLPLACLMVAPPLLSVIAVFSTTVLLVNWGVWRIIQKYVTPEELVELNHP